MDLNEITYKISGAIFKVHYTFGPGLLESVYQTALSYEFLEQGFYIQTQLGVPVHYNNIKLELGFRIDILVENIIIIEIKSVDILHDVHKKTITHLSETDWEKTRNIGKP